jgi:hypothetical protein
VKTSINHLIFSTFTTMIEATPSIDPAPRDLPTGVHTGNYERLRAWARAAA